MLNQRVVGGQSASVNVALWTQMTVCEGHRVQCVTEDTGSSLLCFVFLQVWINTSDIILVGLRDYQVGWSLTHDTDQTV